MIFLGGYAKQLTGMGIAGFGLALKIKNYGNCNNSAGVPSLVMKPSNWRRTLQSALAEEREIALPDEFERVFRAHHGLVFRTAYRITGNAADAEDVLQTVFLRLFRREADAPVLENEESYLRRAAINAALDVIRSRQTDRTVVLEELPASRRRKIRGSCGRHWHGRWRS